MTTLPPPYCISGRAVQKLPCTGTYALRRYCALSMAKPHALRSTLATQTFRSSWATCPLRCTTCGSGWGPWMGKGVGDQAGALGRDLGGGGGQGGFWRRGSGVGSGLGSRQGRGYKQSVEIQIRVADWFGSGFWGVDRTASSALHVGLSRAWCGFWVVVKGGFRGGGRWWRPRSGQGGIQGLGPGVGLGGFLGQGWGLRWRSGAGSGAGDRTGCWACAARKANRTKMTALDVSLDGRSVGGPGGCRCGPRGMHGLLARGGNHCVGWGFARRPVPSFSCPHGAPCPQAAL